MHKHLPIWFQAAAIVTLVSATLGTMWWLQGWRPQHANVFNRHYPFVYHFYYFMVWPVTVLIVRFICRFAFGLDGKPRAHISFWTVAIIAVPVVLLALFPPFFWRERGDLHYGDIIDRLVALLPKLW